MSGRGVCVFGSLNVDLTVRLDRFHLPGETVTGRSFHTFTGGKGGNQAVAAARLGGAVRMLGCVGDDANGVMYLDVMRREGVDVQGIKQLTGQTTGVALIEVDDGGENRIAVVPGANGCLTADMVNWVGLTDCGFLLLQLETPMPGVVDAVRQARVMGWTVILDPAPAAPLPDELLSLCDYVTPNETELAAISGQSVDSVEQAQAACMALIRRGAKKVINKRGAQGCLLVSEAGAQRCPGFPVHAVDTTAAGDTFNAAFAVGLSRGMGESAALRFANGAAALSTTGLGAQAAMPGIEDTLRFIGRQLTNEEFK